ncbi:anti-sigma factor family protein [Stigmatella erecta]|uniref:Putative zinc-finger n=1 Tax=Stigmatella erecta TaxID=83460 RepID=A0A1I0L6N5_9BACT|nr:zf-HC2 domain-containing protein [Stigmatella erecta]SEU34737.1 Putative zinc-finger [Stigmatella erecta]
MAGNPACERFIPFLSPYIDGELTPAERVNVERHLAACKECMGRTADFRAEAGLLRVGLDMAVDEVDFKDFTQKVMARITPEKPPLLERLKLSLSEMFLYQRTAMVSSLATAAVLTVVAVPLLMGRGAPEGYGAERMTVQRVSAYEPARVAPVVMETDNGGAIIWLVDQDTPGAQPGQDEDGGTGAGLERDGLRREDAPRPMNPASPPDTQGGSL